MNTLNININTLTILIIVVGILIWKYLDDKKNSQYINLYEDKYGRLHPYFADINTISKS